MRLCVLLPLLLLAGCGTEARRPARERSTRLVYTYYRRKGAGAAAAELESSWEAVRVWNASWTAAGWKTRILGASDARAHPSYADYAAAFLQLPQQKSDDDIGAYLAWVAVAAAEGARGTQAGALYCDWDVLNTGAFAAPQPLPPKLTSLSGGSPRLLLGGPGEFARLASELASSAGRVQAEPRRFVWRDGKLHISDSVLFAAGVEDGSFASTPKSAVREWGGDGADGAASQPLIHFPALAVRLKGNGRSQGAAMADEWVRLRGTPSAPSASRAAAWRPPACEQPESAWPLEVPRALRPLVCEGEPAEEKFCFRPPSSSPSAQLTCLPSIVGIGFEKAGTTKLWHLLAQHPGLCSARDKEAALMLPTSPWPEKLQAQLLRGNRTAKLGCMTGEFTPFYVHVGAGGGPGADLWSFVNRTHALLPRGAKLLVGVREPVARTVSNYLYHLGGEMDCERRPRCFPGKAGGSLRQAVCFALDALGGGEWIRAQLAPPAASAEARLPFPAEDREKQYPHWDILSDSLYDHALAPWLALFGDQRVAVFSKEELWTSPHSELARILSFLGLDSEGGLPPGSVYSETTLYSEEELTQHAPAGAAAEGAGPGAQGGARTAEVEAFLGKLFAPATKRLNERFGLKLTVGAEVGGDALAAEAVELCRGAELTWSN